VRVCSSSHAGELAPLGAQIAGLYLEFLNRVLRRDQNGIDICDVERLAVQILRALISKRPVNLIISPAKGVHLDGCSRRTPLRHHGCCQFNQIKYVPPIEGQFVDLALLDAERSPGFPGSSRIESIRPGPRTTYTSTVKQSIDAREALFRSFRRYRGPKFAYYSLYKVTELLRDAPKPPPIVWWVFRKETA
jgi:hypothetical protein